MVRIIQLFLVLVLSFINWANASGSRTESIGTTVYLDSGEYPPYYSSTMAGNGVVASIVVEAFALQGFDVRLRWFPWARAYRHVASGQSQGSFTGARTAEREKLFLFSDPVISNEIVFFHLKSYPFSWQNFDDLKNVSIGGTLGYGYSSEFAKADEEGRIQVERVSNDETNFRKLLGNRIRIFPISKNVGLYKLNQAFSATDISSLTCHTRPLISNNVHLILSRALPESEYLMEQFNTGLAKLKLSGRLDTLSELDVESRIACRDLPENSDVQNASN